MKNNRAIKAIPTLYNGVKFRSRMESYFAKWCDTWGLHWMYEPEGYEYNGNRYLPDFYLPEGNTIVEVKPIISSNENTKIVDLMHHINPEPDDDYDYDNDKIPEAWIVQPSACGCLITSCYIDCEWHDLMKPSKWGAGVGPVLCDDCKRPYVKGYGGWDCRNCGYYDGDHTWKRDLDWGIDSGYRDNEPSNLVPFGKR